MNDRDRQRATAVCILTPPGRGAVATVAVRGERAIEQTARWFRSAAGKPLDRFAVGRIVFGRWVHGAANDAGGEEVVVCRRAADQVEVHCHGGDAAAESIVSALEQTGCYPMAAAEWANREEADGIAAEARLALADAATGRTAQILLDQWRGALRTELQSILRAIHDGAGQAAFASAVDLLGRYRVGAHLTEPWKVVLAGRPNVGKSSLINAILGYQRSIVFDQPGTTRDVVTATTVVDGWPVELADTAGLRDSGDAIETGGVLRAQKQLEGADAVVLIFDRSQPWTDDDRRLADRFPAAILAFNKADLPAAIHADPPSGIGTSAIQATGIERLIAAIGRRLVSEPPPRGTAIPFTTRQADGLASAAKSLQENDLVSAAGRLHGLVDGRIA